MTAQLLNPRSYVFEIVGTTKSFVCTRARYRRQEQNEPSWLSSLPRSPRPGVTFATSSSAGPQLRPPPFRSPRYFLEIQGFPLATPAEPLLPAP